MQDYASKDEVNMEEDADNLYYLEMPLATSNTNKWTATSTYDVYMANTPRDDEGDKEPPKHRRKKRLCRGAGNGAASNDARENGDATYNAQLQMVPRTRMQPRTPAQATSTMP